MGIGDMGKGSDAGAQDAGPDARSTRQNISPQCWRWNPELCGCQAISCSYAPGPAGKGAWMKGALGEEWEH